MERDSSRFKGMERIFAGVVITAGNAVGFGAELPLQTNLFDSPNASDHRILNSQLPSEIAFSEFTQNKNYIAQVTAAETEREDIAETLNKIKSTLLTVGFVLIATYGVSRIKDGANDFERKVLYTALGVAYLAAGVNIAEVWTNIDTESIVNLGKEALSPLQ